MSKQERVFKDGEGDSWYERNKSEMDGLNVENDDVIRMMGRLERDYSSVLEIGCADGCRLEVIRRHFGAKDLCGLDPSSNAITSGQQKYPEIGLQVGTASSLPFDENRFDTIIFGFCLYLCDRSDLFNIAAAADRVLADNGVIIIKDFSTRHYYSNEFAHQNELRAYKMNYEDLWLWNPGYQRIAFEMGYLKGAQKHSQRDSQIGVSVLQKDLDEGFLHSPYAKMN
jgi:ubiquinone/menaquinone biosynthesis C-methylase UbiE